MTDDIWFHRPSMNNSLTSNKGPQMHVIVAELRQNVITF